MVALPYPMPSPAHLARLQRSKLTLVVGHKVPRTDKEVFSVPRKVVNELPSVGEHVWSWTYRVGDHLRLTVTDPFLFLAVIRLVTSILCQMLEYELKGLDLL